MTRTRVRFRFPTQEGVYGVVLVSGMIVGSGLHAASVSDVFVAVVATVIVFWAAHVYAGTVAHHRVEKGRFVGLPEALRVALRRSSGLLVAAFLPVCILLLGASRVIPDQLAVWAALWAGVVVLGVVGFVAFRGRGSRLVVCVLGSLGTAAFGVAMIALKAVLH